ncbi:DUF4832 domain-containing protein [Nitrospira lenta]|uniref:DUF4832 domain-containing protein n=1 Tax=Nitrospira lenta TaxID=1436998 RepID=A0A330LAS7_9BACT|nr:DUF4832 domain-containing protein [Nitrospira lenta]SPP66204.1 conserved exported hypothetical protein [Nitrospira lenta]
MSRRQVVSIIMFSYFTIFSASIGASEIHKYEESTARLIAPERGFYKYFHQNEYGFPEYIDLVHNRDFTWVRKSGFSLVAARISLEKYRYSDISEEFLKQLDEGFRAIRAGGVKVVLRFNYNNGNTPGADTSLPWMLRHIMQLRGVLNANADVIAVVQAGFIGAWGEWHSSTHGLDNSEARRAVLEALLDSLPRERSVQLRTPQYKENIYGPPLLEAKAYTNSHTSRTGHHNDCIFASENDLTYPLGKIAYYTEYVAQDSLFVPMGGETCKKYPPRTNCAVAQSVLKQLHYSYLNNNYLQEVIDNWRSEGCYEEIDTHLGYRLVVREAIFDKTTKVGSVLNIEALLENTGWAPPFNPRRVIVTLESLNGVLVKSELTPDARRLQPGKTTKLGATIRLPQDMKSGEYTIYLSAPDSDPKLHNRYEYAIPFANIDYQLTEARLPLGQVTIVGR